MTKKEKDVLYLCSNLTAATRQSLIQKTACPYCIIGWYTNCNTFINQWLLHLPSDTSLISVSHPSLTLPWLTAESVAMCAVAKIPKNTWPAGCGYWNNVKWSPSFVHAISLQALNSYFNYPQVYGLEGVLTTCITRLCVARVILSLVGS